RQPVRYISRRGHIDGCVPRCRTDRLRPVRRHQVHRRSKCTLTITHTGGEDVPGEGEYWSGEGETGTPQVLTDAARTGYRKHRHNRWAERSITMASHLAGSVRESH